MNINESNKYFSNSTDYQDINKDKVVYALSQAITYKTVSYEDVSLMSEEAFNGLHSHFEKAFPLVHKNMKKTLINDWSLLYLWKGSDPSLKPALFMAHLDVVPVMPGTEDDWEHPPFAGTVDGDFIWGRGSIDTKSQVIGELSAAEYLLEKGYTPKRDIYFAYGHDEETMGINGASAIKEYLKNNGIQLEYVMDEGGGFKMGSDFGAPENLLAKIDIFEKGYVDIIIEANGRGGHSSRPAKQTNLGKVANAIAKIEENQFSPKINNVVWNMFKSMENIITEEPFKTYVKTLDESNEKFAKFLCENEALAPLVHTTTAPTMINGSPAPNVLPEKVKATINFRIAPEDTMESILEHCINTANDPSIAITISKGFNPSKISKIDSIGYNAMVRSTEKFFKDVVVVPSLVTGGTDCRYFEDICDCCYRFRPYIDNMIFTHTVHATNERCHIPSLIQGIKIITDVMVSTCF